jgi:aspartate-semialdehyde dehydrogenase
MGYRVAVVGATGNVGREMLNILEEVNFPVEKIHAIASRKSIGLEVNFGDRSSSARTSPNSTSPRSTSC